MNDTAFHETALSTKEAIEKLKAAKEALKAAKDTTITTEQAERFTILEKAIPKAISKARKSKTDIKLHELIASCQ